MIRLLKNFFHLAVAVVTCLYYRFPARKMLVIGVTGTSGKTTTAHLIYHILREANLSVSMISTVGAFINGRQFDTGYHVTTPTPFFLQRFIKMAKDQGDKYLVLEVTSHALDQKRVWGIPFEIGVVTNISHEHLDYHGSFKDYLRAKAKLLSMSKICILNKDEKNYRFLRQKCFNKIVTYGLKTKADVTVDKKVKSFLQGQFNLYNSLAATAVAMIIKIDKNSIRKALADFPGVAGRLEEIKSKRPFRVFIDFAHKPDALKQVLMFAKSITKNKLIVVFGCAGLRDKAKRPMMGKIAANFADVAVLTAEDPRTEDVREIIQEIARGCILGGMIEKKRNKDNYFDTLGQKYFFRIPDRQEAINFSLRKLAKRGDVVLLCGKGHEKSLCYGKTEYPWDEKKAVQKALYATIN